MPRLLWTRVLASFWMAFSPIIFQRNLFRKVIALWVLWKIDLKDALYDLFTRFTHMTRLWQLTRGIMLPCLITLFVCWLMVYDFTFPVSFCWIMERLHLFPYRIKWLNELATSRLYAQSNKFFLWVAWNFALFVFIHLGVAWIIM